MTTNHYYEPTPLDFVLLELMPEKGMIGGIHWKGRRAADMLTDIIEGTPELKGMLTMNQTQARLRSMSVAGHTESFKTIGGGGGKIWARTPQGTEFMAKRVEYLGQSEA